MNIVINYFNTVKTNGNIIAFVVTASKEMYVEEKYYYYRYYLLIV